MCAAGSKRRGALTKVESSTTVARSASLRTSRIMPPTFCSVVIAPTLENIASAHRQTATVKPVKERRFIHHSRTSRAAA